MKKGAKISISIIASLLVIILLAGLIYYCFPWNREFFNNAKKEFVIPGLDTKFTPQGMSKLANSNDYIISGYMSDGAPSRFYLVDGEKNEIKKYFTLEINGKNYNEHAGGVVSYGATLWTVSSNEQGGFAYRFMLEDVKNVDNGGVVSIKDYFNTNNTADCVFAHDGFLYVGEFYLKDKYETEQNHHLKTPAGEENRAMIFAYQISETNKYGLVDVKPDKAISVGKKCQGIAISSEGNFVVSTSYGLSDSTIYVYKDILNIESVDKYRVGLNEVPLYYLDSSTLISSKTVPAMSEEIVINNDIVYILFESSASKYKLFNRVRLDSVYSVTLDFLKK